MKKNLINISLTILLVFSCFSQVRSQSETIMVKNIDGQEIDLNELIAEKSKEKALVLITSFSFCDYCNILARKVKEKSLEKGLDTEVILFINGKVNKEQKYGFDSYASYKEFVKQKGVENLINVHSHTGDFERLIFGNDRPATPYVYTFYNTENIYVSLGYFEHVNRNTRFNNSAELYAEDLIVQLKSIKEQGVVKSSVNSGEHKMDLVYKSGLPLQRSVIVNNDTTYHYQMKTEMEDGEQKSIVKQYEAADESQGASLGIVHLVKNNKTRYERYYEPNAGEELGLYRTVKYVYEPVSVELETEYYPNGKVCKKQKLVDGEVKSYYYKKDGSESGKSIYCGKYWKVRK